MSNQTPFWSDTEREAVGCEIKRLFTMQDKPFTDDKKNLLVYELEQSKLPAGAVIAGVRLLFNDDLKSIKFITLKEAAKRYVTREIDYHKCDHCRKQGVIGMRVVSGPPHVFLYEHDTYIACTCSRGKTLASAHGLCQWNGLPEQINGRFKMVRLGLYVPDELSEAAAEYGGVVTEYAENSER